MNANAQDAIIRAILVDAATDEGLGFVTVSLSNKNSDKVYKYTLSDEKGSVEFPDTRKGTFIFKAELMGYKVFTKEITVKGSLDLGVLKMEEDKEVLEAASVSAVGNPIVIKKDTIEYNASSYKTTESDVLADLIKKLPGVDISANGAITVNGTAISKITIEGKTFFLDDPSVALGNIPAKLINKVKVVKKKSEQAEFTGIDDGEGETVIDLSVKKDMMNGFLGNFSLGAGRDVPVSGAGGEARYQGAAFAGRFSDKTQVSIILNGNNTNNRGFGEISDPAMGSNARKAGGNTGDGITTSYMGGANVVSDLLNNAMILGGNYLYNHSSNSLLKSDYRTTYLKDASGNDYNRISDSESSAEDINDNHRLGVRLEHKFSKNSSLIFQSQIDCRRNRFIEMSSESIEEDYYTRNTRSAVSDAKTDNNGESNSLNTSGFGLYRQRLGIPGRTLTIMCRYNFGSYDLDGYNRSFTRYFKQDTEASVDQMYNYLQKSYTTLVTATYTEPLGNRFYLQARYSYDWKSDSTTKETYDFDNEAGRYSDIINEEYSSRGKNHTNTHDIGANLLYQHGKAQIQAGFSSIPTRMVNSTDKYDYDSGVIWNWSPQASAYWTFNNNNTLRVSYKGATAQPSINKLQSIADNTNPLDISFGNPFLNPYFSHNVNGDFKFSKKKKFFTLNATTNCTLVQNPIVNAIWYGTDGVQYTMPMNGPTSAKAGFNVFSNTVIGNSGLSLNGSVGLGWSKSGYYAGDGVDMSIYKEEGYYAFMEDFLKQGTTDISKDGRFVTNSTNTITPNARIGAKYSVGCAELRANGGTSINKSWYRLGNDVSDNTTTFSNYLRAASIFSFDAPGLVFKADFSYNWYDGFSQKGLEPEAILNAEIQKLLFKKKGTLALKGFDLLGQAKTMKVSDDSNYHLESCSNTLGRYIILLFTYRFGNQNKKTK